MSDLQDIPGPAPVPEPSYVAETLAWCNARRADQGLEPLERLPTGFQSDPSSCPCGKATNLYVDNAQYTHTREEWFGGNDKLRLPLPTAVRVFVTDFDEGRLPQYVDPADTYEA